MNIEIGVLIGIAGTIFGIGIGYLNWRRNDKNDTQKSAEEDGELKADIRYIRNGIEEIKVDIKVQEKRHSELAERVTRVEESTKQAHRRIDELKR